MFQLKAVLLSALCLASLAAGANAPSTSASADARESRTTLDLMAFRLHAEEAVGAAAGTAVRGGRIWFQDGASSVDFPPLFDHAALVFVPDVQPVELPGEMKLVFVATLQGTAAVELIRLDEQERVIRFQSADGIVTLKDGVSAERAAVIVGDLEKQVPGLTTQYLEGLNIITFSASHVSQLAPAFVFAAGLDDVLSVDVSDRTYRVPFEFDQAIDLGTGEASKSVDLVQLTTVTKFYRNQGLEFTTEPSLPAPFGPGPVPSNP